MWIVNQDSLAKMKEGNKWSCGSKGEIFTFDKKCKWVPMLTLSPYCRPKFHAIISISVHQSYLEYSYNHTVSPPGRKSDWSNDHDKLCGSSVLWECDVGDDADLFLVPTQLNENKKDCVPPCCLRPDSDKPSWPVGALTQWHVNNVPSHLHISYRCLHKSQVHVSGSQGPCGHRSWYHWLLFIDRQERTIFLRLPRCITSLDTNLGPWSLLCNCADCEYSIRHLFVLPQSLARILFRK